MSGPAWMPIPQQMSDAAQLRPGAYTRTSMQQALGMIVVLGLLAGLVPFAVNWVNAARMDAALPLAEAARASVRLNGSLPGFFVGIPGLNLGVLAELYPALAGLPQPLPGWLAAGLSALGVWLTVPLNWLGIWIVYGAMVMVVNKSFGATCTLQRFYAATGYAAVPLLLIGLSPVACLGAIATLVGMVWSATVYVRANQDVTGLPLLQSTLAVALPVLVIVFGLLFVFILFLGSLVFAVL